MSSLSGVSIQRNEPRRLDEHPCNEPKKVRNKRNERNSRKNGKFQPIETELSTFQFNSSF